MKNLLLGTALALTFLLQPAASATEEEAEVCLRTKVWDGYAEGWAIRTMTSTTLSSGATRNYLVTLYQGNEYLFQACADEGSVNVDILLYDLNGDVVKRDDSTDREPQFSFSPPATETYYVVVYARELADKAGESGVGLAVTYR